MAHKFELPDEVKAVGDDAVSLIEEALRRHENGLPGVATYLFLARGRLRDHGLASKKKGE